MDKSDKFAERRARRFVISNCNLIQIFRGRVKVDNEPLPKDAVIGHVAADYMLNAVVAFIFSDEYPPVPVAHEIPLADGPLGLRMYQFADGELGES